MLNALIVEDDPELRRGLQNDIEQLYPCGKVKVIGAADSYLAAEELLYKSRIDIALLDISLKDEQYGGIKLGKMINEDFNIPFIYITGLPEMEGFEKAKGTIPDGFIKKPYDTTSLYHALELLVQKVATLKKESLGIPVFKPNKESSVFMKSGRKSFSRIRFQELVYLTVDDHYISAYHWGEKYPVLFRYPGGLNEFHQDYFSLMAKDFFKVDRKYVINTDAIQKVDASYAYIRRPVPDIGKNNHEEKNYLAVPVTNKGRAWDELCKRLGIEPGQSDADSDAD